MSLNHSTLALQDIVEENLNETLELFNEEPYLVVLPGKGHLDNSRLNQVDMPVVIEVTGSLTVSF